MKLRKADYVFLLAVVAVVAGVSLLPSPKEQNPRMPSDADHRSAIREADCQRCHAPGAARPLRIPPHPRRTDCLRCHARDE